MKKYCSISNLVIIFFLIVGVSSTVYSFTLEQKIQELYYTRSSLDIVFTRFFGLHALTKINPWQGLSDETLQDIYKNLYVSFHGNEPPDEILTEITSRASYNDHVEILFKIQETETAESKISTEIKTKQGEQIIFLWVTIISNVLIAFLGLKK